jgi:ubiquinone/menaquinone biosynthesis C-methylase UbiE
MSINETDFNAFQSDFQSDGINIATPPSVASADSDKSNLQRAYQRQTPRRESEVSSFSKLPSALPADLEPIHQHWERRGRKYGMSPSASWVDETMLHREGEVLNRYIREGDRVLDAGCANGYTTLQLARRKRIRIVGVDYAQSMIDYANTNLGRAGLLEGSVSFRVGNFLKLDYPDNTFDKVITKRCMINLGSPEHQKTALLEAWRVLKPGGLFLISEVSEQSSDNLNRLRRTLGLETMTPLWHNCYLNEEELFKFAEPYFELKQTKRFSSSYYALTWVIYPFFVRQGQRNYKGWFHRLSASVPQVGDWGLQKLYVLQKRAS